jgi:hypothetical protein
MPKHRSSFSKKGKFCGNQYSKQKRTRMSESASTTTSSVENPSTAESTSDTSVSASARKINLGNKEMPDLNKNEVSGYRFINLEILGTIFKLSSLYVCMAIIYIIVLFVETPRKFITAKLSHIISTDEDPGLRIESFAVKNLRGVSTNKTIIYI